MTTVVPTMRMTPMTGEVASSRFRKTRMRSAPEGPDELEGRLPRR